MTKRHNTAYFIERARKIHGNRYDYSQTSYTRLKDKVTILCAEHGAFRQAAGNHIAGNGCPTCGASQKTPDDYIGRAISVHGHKYGYDNLNYIKTSIRVNITCRLHGDFKMFPLAHIRGDGCPECAGRVKITTKEFVKRAVAVHGDRYDYSSSRYTKKTTPLQITCKDHGVFLQRPEAHWKGSNCPKCARLLKGWGRSSFAKFCAKNNNGVGKLYVIECSQDNEVFYKIGITSRIISKRFGSKDKMPYDYKEAFVILGSPNYIYSLELRLHSLLKDNSYTPMTFFKGNTECFTTIKPIEKLLKELSNTEQLQLLA